MPSIFTRIINGEIPCHKVAESNRYFAFLDINPLAKGHTLVIPKEEVDYIFDLEDETLKGLMAFAKKVAKAIEKTIECNRISVGVFGLPKGYGNMTRTRILKINIRTSYSNISSNRVLSIR